MTGTAKVMKQPSFREIRALLFEQVQALRDGQIKAVDVQATSNAIGKIINSVKVELEFYKLIGQTPHIPELLEGPSSNEPNSQTVSEFRKAGA